MDLFSAAIENTQQENIKIDLTMKF